MATTDVKILRMNEAVASIDDNQLTIEPSANAISGIKNLAYKDQDSSERQLAVLDANARFVNLTVTGTVSATINSDNVTEGTTNKFLDATEEAWVQDADDSKIDVLYGNTATSGVASDTVILAETLGGVDYPSLAVSTAKSWTVELEARTTAASTNNLGGMKKWAGQVTFTNGVTGYDDALIGFCLPTGEEVAESNLTFDNPTFAITSNSIRITCGHSSDNAGKDYSVSWRMRITELAGAALIGS